MHVQAEEGWTPTTDPIAGLTFVHTCVHACLFSLQLQQNMDRALVNLTEEASLFYEDVS